MKIERSIDIENAVRLALKDFFTIYCRPLPEDFKTPSLLVQMVGGQEMEQKIDEFEIVIDSRAEDSGEALDLLLEAVAALRAIAESQTTPLRYIIQNSIASWDSDPVRPELAMCSARITILAHKETKNIEQL